MMKGGSKNIRRYTLTNTQDLSIVQAACATQEPLTAVYCLGLAVTRGRVSPPSLLHNFTQHWSNLVNCTESAESTLFGCVIVPHDRLCEYTVVEHQQYFLNKLFLAKPTTDCFSVLWRERRRLVT